MTATLAAPTAQPVGLVASYRDGRLQCILTVGNQPLAALEYGELAVALNLSGAQLSSRTSNHTLLEAVAAAVTRYGADRLAAEAYRTRSCNLSYLNGLITDTAFVGEVRDRWGGQRRRDLCHSLAYRLTWQVGKAGAR